jgi:hypothetical protein
MWVHCSTNRFNQARRGVMWGTITMKGGSLTGWTYMKATNLNLQELVFLQDHLSWRWSSAR